MCESIPDIKCKVVGMPNDKTWLRPQETAKSFDDRVQSVIERWKNEINPENEYEINVE